ncbi:TolB family protein [Geodermatophilus sp. DSM 45219]|uniref:TolB family protein n=1 Tax=Geodermatophilus sp. DSM 45219 TaxID=1881103 RepID=UPI00088423FF|nr:TolB family protein [Geodermatophilus sp. DSM 45219]SDO06879.1 TolB protein [Geodermatophilus sp. DSM 45219]
MRRTAVTLASSLAVVPLLALPAQAGDRVLPFVFTSDRDGDSEIYRVRADGRVVQLTSNDVHDGDAVWSPDGRELAFVSDRDGDLEVFVMDADGSDVRQLTHNEATPDAAAWDHSPDWAPDGDALVFVSDREDPEGDIYRMAADGSEQTRLTETPFVTDYSPSWSPNGRHIAFGSTQAGIDNPEVYRIRTDGSGLRRLTRTADGIWDDNPEYSPDGRTIVFSSNRGGADRDLYTMRADGGRVRELTGEVGVDEWFPAWTPDGRQVVYWSLTLDGSARDTAWTVDRDGTDPRPLTSGESNDSFPDARPPTGR